jgi:putative ABC transport system permease protein
VESWLNELRLAARFLARRRGPSMAAIVALGAGIGAATAVFSVLYGVLLRPLPFPDSERLVAVQAINRRGQRVNDFSEPNLDDLRAGTRSFEAMALYTGATQSVSGGLEPVRAGVAIVSEGFFDVLRTRPVIGRSFAASDQASGAEPTAIVGHEFWRRSLGGTTDLDRIRLRVGERVHTVIGVLAPGPPFPPGAEIWVPKGLYPRNTNRTANSGRVIGRVRGEVPIEQAAAELSVMARGLREQYRDDTSMTDVEVRSLREALAGSFRRPLFVLLGAVGLLLLAACANVANLLLAQAAARQGELAVRMAIGARPMHVVRQLMSEALVLSLAGGSLGVLLALGGVRALLAFEPRKLPRVGEVGLNLEVLAFSLALSLATALGLGLVTAWRATRRAPLATIAHGGRVVSGAASRRLLDVLVASQVAVTAALLVAAGLLGRSLQRLMDVDPGFRVENVVAMDIALPSVSSPERLAARMRLHDDVIERLARVAGTHEAGAVSVLPLGGGGPEGTFLAIDREIADLKEFARLVKDPALTGQAQFRLASEGYFRVMGIPLRRGRLLEAGDGPDAPHVAVISESLARKQWPNQVPIGRHVQFGNMDGDLRLFTIVGVVGDVREAGLDAEPKPTFYASTRQRPQAPSSLSFVARVDGDVGAFVSTARAIVREIEPEVPPRFRTLAEMRQASVADRRFTLLLLGLFAGAALSLAAVGIYGVTSYSVATRTRDIGLRMALGARPAQVLAMVMLQGSRPAVCGALIGIVGASALSRVLRGLLYEVKPADPATVVGVALLLAVASLGTCLLPARHAARVDPAVALRNE